MESLIPIFLVSDDKRLHRKITLLTQQYQTPLQIQWIDPQIAELPVISPESYCFIDLDTATVNMLEWLKKQNLQYRANMYCFSRNVSPELVQKIRLLFLPSVIPRSKMEELLQRLLKMCGC